MDKINQKTLIATYFKQLYKKSLDAIIILNKNNRISHANDSFLNLFGYTLEEILHKDIKKLIVPESKLNESLEITSDVLNQKIVRKETKRLKKDGSEFWVSIIGLPIVVDNNSRGLFVIYQDISYSMEHRKKSEEAARIKSALLANMSHEFRTPLSAILGFSEILKEELSEAEHITMLKDIHTSAKRLLNTLNSVLELSQLEAADFQPKLEKNNVIKLIRKSSEKFIHTAKTKNLEFEIISTPENVFCNIDKEIFEQIINNILDNAFKYTYKGKVQLTIDKTDEHCIIKICDTGIGILKEHHDLIFNEFRQVSEGMNRNYEGTGLGLTLAKKMINLLKGDINLESEPGAGSTFIITLPLFTEENNNEKIYATTSMRGLKRKLLLVEDNKTNKILMKRFLSNDFDVTEASGGEEALELINNNYFDIILMDINLGMGINGMETARIIRKDKNHSSVPIIAVTGYALSSERNEILSSGFTGYISKPFTRQGLLEVLESSFS